MINGLEREKINILHLGCNSNEVQLFKESLEKSEIDSQLTIISGKTQLSELEKYDLSVFDLVVADLNLQPFQWLAIFKIVKENPPTPILFLSNFLTRDETSDLLRFYKNDFQFSDYQQAPKLIPQIVKEARIPSKDLSEEAELNYRNGILRTLMESVIDLIYFKDLEGRYMEVNTGFCQFFELTQNQVIGKLDKNLYDENLSKQIKNSDQEVLKRKVPLVFELTHYAKGQRFVLETVKGPLRDKEGQIIGIAGVTRDITKKKIDEDALRTNQHLLIQSEKQSLSGSFKLDLKNNTLYCSQQFIENLGLPAGEEIIPYESFLSRVYGPEREIFEVELKRAIRNKTEFYMEHRYLRLNDKKIIYCKTHIIPDEETQDIYYGVITNTSKDRQLRKAIIDIQDKERKIIASNLHDSLGQKLVAAKMFLNESQEMSESLQRAKRLIDQTIEEIRSLSRNLSLYTIQGFGLKSAIEDVQNSFPKSIIINTTLDFQEKDLNDEINTQIFRIIQEGMTNILKYADARNVQLAIKRENDFLNLIIADDGVGFDPNLESKGNGIKNIRERVARCSGYIEIKSGKKGTKLKIKVPIK